MLENKVIINIILKSQKSKNLIIKKVYDIILVIVDRLTKYCYINLFQEKYIVEQLKAIMLKKIIYYFKISKKITSNRIKLFIYNYQKALILL